MTGNAVNAVAEVDRAFVLIFGISAVILVLITGAMIWFVHRYSRERNPVPSEVDGNLLAELIWTAVPTLLVMGMFYYGWTSYTALRTVPDDALPVRVTARMWSWGFMYPEGKKSNVLYVPVGRAVRLDLESLDVIHGFYAPAFRIKVDAVPGMPTHAWFRADKPGSYDIFCSVYCGQHHANMITRIEAVSPEDFARWLTQTPGQLRPAGEGVQATGPAPGRAALERLGCLGCHSLDGTPSVGPTLKAIWGRPVTVLRKGAERSLTADADYLRRSILEPDADVVKGFDPIMPPYAGQITDEEMHDILGFLEHGDGPAAGAFAVGTAEAQGRNRTDGRAVMESAGCLGCHSTDGTPLVGPSFKALLGSTVTVMERGRERTTAVDRDFVLAKLADPGRMVVKGFDPLMPPFTDLAPGELEAILEYLGDLGQSGDHAGHHP